MNSIKQHPALYKIVVTHYFFAALCFLILTVMMLFSSDALTGHYFHPKLLAITHMAALGWGTTMIFGAGYQLLPVVLETDLYSHRLAYFSFGLFAVGLVFLVCSFWVFDPGLHMQIGSLLLLAGIILFGTNVFLTCKQNRQQDAIVQEFIITSCIWLICTAIVGVLLVFNFRYPFLPKDHLHFLKLHAHMGMGGWFLLLIIGVSAKLLPMFLVSTKPKTSYLNQAYYLINAALILFVADTYLFGLNFKTYFIAAAGVLGIVAYLIFVRSCFTSRIRNAIDLPMVNTGLSFVLLSAALTILPFIVYYHLRSDPVSAKLTVVYGTLLFMGWISALILGQTFKTLPFIVWVKQYQSQAGRVKTPMPADLYHKKLLKVQSLAFFIFALSFFIGLLLSDRTFIYIGIANLLIAALTYFSNVLIILFHKSKTG